MRESCVDEAPLIGDACVAHGKLHQPALVAALRYQHLHATLRAGREPRLEQFGVLWLARQVHFGGGGPILIELLDRRLKYFCRRARNAFVRGQLHALEHFAGAHDKYVNHRARRSHVQAEGIPVAQPHGRNFLLAVAKCLHGSRGIAKVRGFLEPFRRRRVSHRCRQPLDELVIFPFEEQVGMLHGHVVLLLRTDCDDARRDTSFDVVLEARPLAMACDDLVA